MSCDRELVDSVVDLMSGLGHIRAKAMFGGYGFYQDDLPLAIMVEDVLYFKTDGQTRPDFEERGLGPFTYEARGKTVTMQYYEAPPEALENPADMMEWARKALAVSLRALARKPKKKTTRP